MKRLILLALIVVMMISFGLTAGCSGSDDPGMSEPDQTSLEGSSASVGTESDESRMTADTDVSASSPRAASSAAVNSGHGTSVSEDDWVFEEEWSKPAETTSASSDPIIEEESVPMPSGDPVILGVGYDYKTDDFYKKDQIKVTWLNVWNGSTEFWWADLAATTSVSGIYVNINGNYTCMDSNNPVHRASVARDAFEAGIDVLAMDLTNGFAGWRSAASDYERLCYENGRKFTVAVHPTDAKSLEQMCRYVWLSYAGPGYAEYSPAYLYKDGKPLMILYCTSGEFAASTAATTPYAKKFRFHWASGEDSQKDKWGWQIEPQDGPMASSDSMFITPSVDWNSPRGHAESWRSSLAMLDFCFLAATESRPKFWIIGSMDDLFERNGWMKMDTTNSFYQSQLDPDSGKYRFSGNGLKLRDATGAISTDVYYERVKSWNKGTVKPFFAGGIIADGAYTITNTESNRGFGVIRPAVGQANDIGAAFYSGKNLTTKMETYYWFYHLGDNVYRIIKLSSGLSLTDLNGKLVQDWTDAVNTQKWKIIRQSNGSFQIRNQATGRLLQEAGQGKQIGLVSSASGAVNWKLTAVPNRTFS